MERQDVHELEGSHSRDILLPKFQYGFNATPIKIPTGLFC